VVVLASSSVSCPSGVISLIVACRSTSGVDDRPHPQVDRAGSDHRGRLQRSGQVRHRGTGRGLLPVPRPLAGSSCATSPAHDGLTGPTNRALSADRAGHALELHCRDLPGLAICFLDPDGFKALNDTKGHAAGDDLLAVLWEDCREPREVARAARHSPRAVRRRRSPGAGAGRRRRGAGPLARTTSRCSRRSSWPSRTPATSWRTCSAWCSRSPAGSWRELARPAAGPADRRGQD
jgi:hypothetical protein